MNRLLLAVVGSLVLAGTASAQGVGFLKGESTTGLSKICVYDGPSGRTALTVGSAQLCPLQMSTDVPSDVPYPPARRGGVDVSIYGRLQPVPFVNPFAALAEARAQRQDAILRQQQIELNRQQLAAGSASTATTWETVAREAMSDLQATRAALEAANAALATERADYDLLVAWSKEHLDADDAAAGQK